MGVSVQALAFSPPIQARVLRYVCLCTRSACTPQILAWVCNVGVCAWVRVSCAPPFLPGVCVVCVCAWILAGCVPPYLALVLGCVPLVVITGVVFCIPLKQKTSIEAFVLKISLNGFQYYLQCFRRYNLELH